MAKSIIDLTRGVPTTAKGWLDVFGRINRFLRVSGDELVFGGDIALPAQSVGTDEIEDKGVTDEKLRDSQAQSVIGRAVGTAGKPSDIQAGTDGFFLRQAGGVLSFGAIAESDIPSTIARDSEVTSAIASHEAALDPHPGYTTAAELTTAISNHEAASDPHPGYVSSSELSAAIASGTYTPTLTNVTNIDDSTAFTCQYMRVGTVVTVSGVVSINPTAASSTELGISLPIASEFTGATDAAGVAFCADVAGLGAAVWSDPTNNRAAMVFVATDTTNRAMRFTFTYRII